MIQKMKNIWDELVCYSIVVWDYIKYSFMRFDKTYISCPDKFKFITLNLRREVYNDGEKRWHFRKEQILEFIKQERPHIICSQEVMPHMFKYLIYKIGNIYGHYGIDSFNGLQLNYSPVLSSEGNTIMYDKTKYELLDKGKFWLSDKPNKPSSTWGNKCLRTCIYVKLKDVNEKIIYVFATHLDHQSGESRKKSAELIAKKIQEIAGNNTFYLCGDFNAFINSEELEAFNIFDNTYNHNKNLTFHCYHKVKTKPLDAIYYKYGESYQIEIPNIKISDHSPVIIYDK
jgi:endonuclease/exonuclease/phosphatase family metal-dependent hydrolase